MPHYKCVTCRTRLRASKPATAALRDLCPHCGSLLEPVSDLAEVVGFRAIASVDGPAAGSGASAHERIAQRIGDLVTHRGRARELVGEVSAGSFDPPAASAVARFGPRPGR
jgi:hypothetical protein